MKTSRLHLGLVAAIALMATVMMVSGLWLTVPVAASGCDGLTCWAQEDCGSKCFCNRPSSTCYLDAPLP